MPSTQDSKLPEQEQNPPYPQRNWRLPSKLFVVDILRYLVLLVGLCVVAYIVFCLNGVYLDIKDGLLSALNLWRNAATSVSTSAGKVTCTVVGVGCESLPEGFPESAKVLNYAVNPESVIVHLDNEARNVHSLLEKTVNLGKWDIKQLAKLEGKTWRIGNDIRFETDVSHRKELGQPIVTMSMEMDGFLSAMIELRHQATLSVDFFIFEFIYLDETLIKLLGGAKKTRDWAQFDVAFAQFHLRLIVQLDEYLKTLTKAYQLATHLRDTARDAILPIQEVVDSLSKSRNSQSFYGQVVRPFTVRGRQDDKNIETLRTALRDLEPVLELLRETRLIVEESLQHAEHAESAIRSEPKVGHNYTQSLQSWKITILGFQQERDRYLAALRS